MARFSDKMKKEKDGLPILKMRIGIHTGPVVVGTLGNDLRVEFKAVGDTVNLASRMEDLAEPGATYVTEETFKLTEGFFRFESLGEREVKGKEESVKTYRVIGPSTRRTRFDVSAERGLTPFVGRERELELLLDGLERVKQGHGQAFSIISEAGVGKSRLLYEFRKATTNQDVTFLEGKCLSYSRGVAYHPIIDIYKSNFDIRESDEDYQIKEKVKRGLKHFDADEASTLPYLLELLSVKDSGFDQIDMSREGKKDRMLEIMIRIPLKASEIQPLILAVEDLHWIDKSSEEALKYVLESISGARILLIFTYRPEFVHTWGGRSYHNQVNLNRLSNRESLTMVTNLLNTEEIHKGLENLILEKTEGVPFFIEQFIKSLQEFNIIERINGRCILSNDFQKLAIPSSIHDVIMARVDSLPEGAKEVLQAGSAIEREFRYDLIKQVIKIPQEELLSHLSLLKDKELLYERGVYPESTYVFKHALTQEVVVNSLLDKGKRILHEDVGNAIEELYKNNIDEYYVVLSEHFMKSENHEKSARYLRLAARRAEKSGLLKEASDYAGKRITCLEKLPLTTDSQKQIIDARTTLGLYYLQLINPRKAKDAVAPIMDKAYEIGDKKRIAQIHVIMGTYYSLAEGNNLIAIQELEKGLKIAEEINDPLSLVNGYTWLAHIMATECEFEKSEYYGQKMLDINISANNLWGQAIIIGGKSYLGYCPLGNLSLAYETSCEAMMLAEQSGDPYSKAQCYLSRGITFYYKGFFEKALKDLSHACEFASRSDVAAWSANSHRYTGDIYFEEGEYQLAKYHYSNAVSVCEQSESFPFILGPTKIALARAETYNGERNIDFESYYEFVSKHKLALIKGSINRLLGDIYLHLNINLPKASELIKEAIDSDKRDNLMWGLGMDYALYAELFKRKGDHLKARENLIKAIEILKECGADGWVGKYEKELAMLSS
jgi:predicted ATPase